MTVLGPLATYMFVPALPAVQRDFAASAGLVQLTFSLAMLAFGVATLIFGPLSDRFGFCDLSLVLNFEVRASKFPPYSSAFPCRNGSQGTVSGPFSVQTA